MFVYAVKQSFKAVKKATARSIGGRSVQDRTRFLQVGVPLVVDLYKIELGFYKLVDQVSTR